MNKKLSKTFVIILLITIVSQVFNMLKSVYLANDFGATQTLDVFYLSNIFTVTIFNVLGVALTTVMIPEYSSATHDNLEKKKSSIENFITIIFFTVLLFIGFLLILLNIGVEIITPDFNLENKQLFLILTTILSVGQLFRVQTSLSIAIAQSEGAFVLPKIASLISAVVPVVYLVFSKKTSVFMLTIFVVIGFIIESTILFLYQIKWPRYRYRFKLTKMDNYSKKLLRNTFPIIISSTIFQIQLLVSNYVIGFLGEGYISILSNTNQIVGIFQLLFVSNIITLIYPQIAKEVTNDIADALRKISYYISYTNALVILLVWGYISLGRELITIMFVRGEFTIADAEQVYLFGIFLVLALPISVIRDYMYRFLYSINKVKIPAFNSIQTVIINIFLILFFIQFLGPYSVVIAPLIGTIISASSIILKIKKLGYNLNIKGILTNLFIYNFLGIIMYYLINIFKITLFSNLLNFLINTLIGLIVYIILLLPYYKIKKKSEGK